MVGYVLERWRGFFFQVKKDRNDYKRDLFWRYIEKKKLIFVFYRFFERFKAGVFGIITGFLFYLACYFFLRFPAKKDCISMVKLKTERWSLDTIFGQNLEKIGLICSGLPSSFLFIGHSSFKDISDIFRLLKIILSRYEPYVALRAIQYLAYYDRFDFEIDAGKSGTVIIFTDANPHGRALMHIARRKGIRSCFVSHGEPNEPIVPIFCNIAYLLGERSLTRYKKNRSRIVKVLYHGHKEIFKKIKKIEINKELKIGIFLSKSTILNETVKLISLLKKTFRCRTILVRSHPNMDLSAIEKRFLRNIDAEISEGLPIERDIERCDLIFAGNSTSHIDALIRGCPSLYYKDLEKGIFDRNGYIRERLILDWDKDMPPDEINNFYQGLNEKNSINYYINIEKDSRESINQINEIIFK